MYIYYIYYIYIYILYIYIYICIPVNHKISKVLSIVYQWEFQDPKIEVLYHIRPYFAGIFPYIGLIFSALYVVPLINRFLLHGH